MSADGSMPAAAACMACARPISAPSSVTNEFSDMFWALNGATCTPCRASHRHNPATSTLLPASEPVPATSNVPRTDAGYCAWEQEPARLPPVRPAMSTARAVADTVTALDKMMARRMSSWLGAPLAQVSAAQVGARLGHTAVDVRPAEAHAERSREGSLAPARVRRGMAAAVAAYDVKHGNGAGPGHQRGAGRGQRGGDAGRNPVGHVVQPGRGVAEPQVPGRTVADHRVEGIDRAVSDQPGTPATAPQSSGATTASEVFSATDSITARVICAGSSRGRIAAAQAGGGLSWRRQDRRGAARSEPVRLQNAASGHR